MRLGTRKSRAPSGVLLMRNGGLDLDEPALVQVVAYELDDAVAHAEVLAHEGTAQVQVAVAHPQQFVDRSVLAHVERRRSGWIEDDGGARQHLDVTRVEVGVGGTFETRGAPCRLPGRPHSARNRSATLNASGASSGWKTTCMRPVLSRRSMNTRPPWSRRRCDPTRRGKRSVLHVRGGGCRSQRISARRLWAPVG